MKTRYFPALLLGFALGVAMPAAVAAPQAEMTAAAQVVPGAVAVWQEEMCQHAESVFAELLTLAETADEKAALTADKEKVLSAITRAATAAAALESARRAYFEAAFERAGESRDAMLADAVSSMENLFAADANMLAALSLWLPEEAGSDEEMNLLRTPALAMDAAACSASCPPPLVAHRASLAAHFTEQLQDSVARSIAASYSTREDVVPLNPMGDPCSGVMWETDDQGNPTPLDAARRRKLAESFAATESAWRAYRKAMLELICPVPRFYATAFPLNNSSLDIQLLDGRDRFLGAIAYGFADSAVQPEEEETEK